MNGLKVMGLFCILSFSLSAQAKEVSISGTHSPEEIKGACDKAGGEYFPQGQSGTYGCENHDKGTMVLCNKSQVCTGFVPMRTRAQNRAAARAIGLKP